MKSINLPESRSVRVTISERVERIHTPCTVSERTECIPLPCYPVTPASNDPATDSQARSSARRAGYALRKSRRAFGIDNFGRYMIVDPLTNFCILGTRYDLSPDDVIEFFKD